MPESAAPKLGKVNSLVSMDVNVPANANGVLYALAGFSGGITCYVKDGILSYEFNLFEIQRTKIKAQEKLSDRQREDRSGIEVGRRIGGPMNVTLKVNGRCRAGTGASGDVASLHFQCHLRHRQRSGFACLP